MLLPIFSRSLWLSSATKSSTSSPEGIRHWIASANWSIDKPITKKHAELVIHDFDFFGDACINDSIRLGNAAFESACSIITRADEQRGWAWQLICYYYASYFAANALMRLSGHGCLNLSAIDCAEINQQAILYSCGGDKESNKLSPGVFYSWVEHGKTPKWHVSTISGKGGVHIQFWIGFMKFLKDIEFSIKNSAIVKKDRTECLGELNNLTSGLKHSGSQNGAWLSEVRNAANYRLDYGIWFPYSDCKVDSFRASELFKKGASGLIGFPRQSQKLEDLERAVQLSGVLLSWLRESLIVIESKSRGQKKELISKGALAFAANL